MTCCGTADLLHWSAHAMLCSHALIIQLMRRAFSFCTHTHWIAHVTSQCEHKHTNNISRTALRVTSWAFHRFIWVKLSSYHINTQKCKSIHGNPVKIKVCFLSNQIQSLLLSHHHSTCALVSEVGYEVGYETLLRTLQQKYLFSRMYIPLLLKLWKLNFKEWPHNISNMF